jgi:Na+-translocating ferredoxin:NAD+ oxidoreductase RnfC subunit
MIKKPLDIAEAVRRAGVIGAGGAGFPTHVKLKAKVDTVIANGSECEPLLGSDRALMVRRADEVVEGVRAAMQATGASRGVIAVKEHYEDAVGALENALPSDGSVRLHFLENYYPAGDEFLLVYEVTGKVIPEGGIPLHVGVVVNNVVTLIQVAHAVSGKPVTDRTVTLAGEFNEPKIVTVPVGTTYSDLFAAGGGLKIPDAVLLDGGPMMGKIVEDPEEGIAKTTSGLVALPPDHFIIRFASKPLSQMIKQSKAACCQCFRCSDLCPRNLIGHELYPHMTMRTIDYNQDEPTRHVTSAFLCSQCGVCELVACDFMLLSPRKIYAAYRRELLARKIRNPHARSGFTVRGQFENTKVSIPMLMKKVDLVRYAGELPFVGARRVEKVRIPLTRHTGAPAVPSVKKGDKVRMCDVVAATPEDKLGAVYHASMAGTVTQVTMRCVEISE